MFVTISVTLDNIIQTMSTWNQRLDSFRLTPTVREVEEFDSTAQLHRSSAEDPSLRNDVKDKNVKIGNKK